MPCLISLAEVAAAVYATNDIDAVSSGARSCQFAPWGQPGLLAYVSQAAGVHGCLGQYTIDWRQPYEATHQGLAEQQQKQYKQDTARQYQLTRVVPSDWRTDTSQEE
jgi:hypothetical protein